MPSLWLSEKSSTQKWRPDYKSNIVDEDIPRQIAILRKQFISTSEQPTLHSVQKNCSEENSY